MAIFVLVPGGHCGSWAWREVSRQLWRAGHEVYTPSLTGMGERSHLANPEINLSTHIQDVVAEIIFSDLREVNLVGYSYSGMVVTGVAEKVPERIANLIYIDAWVPEDGQSCTDLVGPEAAAAAIQAVQAYGEGWKILPNPEDPEPRLTPQPFKTGLEKLNLENELAKKIPRAFIYCTLGKDTGDWYMAPVTRVAHKVKDDLNWRYFEVEADHAVVATHPDQLVVILRTISEG